MPLDLALDLAHALDPVAFVQDRLKFEPDPWQARLLRSCAPWILLNCCRQSGKSTTTAAVALHTALYDPGLILLVSPSLRQSKELFAKVTGFLNIALFFPARHPSRWRPATPPDGKPQRPPPAPRDIARAPVSALCATAGNRATEERW